MSSDRPSQLPKGGATLSERIAALQRKTSNPVPSRAGGLSPGSSHGSSSGRLSPGDSPSRLGGSNASNAVRDRIAKFQGNDDRPLIPRSSFGAAAPNPELNSGARRGYPGSASKGSGAWGEGVLRPQMTGGVWLGGGSGGGWGDPSTAPMRPQLTGGAFLSSGGQRIPSFGSTRMHRGVSSDAVPGSGRDAFADLDPDIILTGRNKPDSVETTPDKATDAPASQSPASERRDGLPLLPDPPATEIDPAKARAARDGLPLTDAAAPIIPEFPSTPSAVPETPKKPTNGRSSIGQSTPDTSIEIGFHGRSPQDVEKLRQKARDLALEDRPLAADPEEPWVLQPQNRPEGDIPKPVDPKELDALAAPAGTGAQEPWVQGYGLPDADIDALASQSRGLPADPNAPGDLPQRAQVERTASGKVDPTDPHAHEIMGAGLLVPRDEVAEAKDLGAEAVRAPISTNLRVATKDLASASEEEGLSGVGVAMTSASSSISADSSVPSRSAAPHIREESTDTAFDEGGPASQFPIPPSTISKSQSNGTITASTSAQAVAGLDSTSPLSPSQSAHFNGRGELTTTAPPRTTSNGSSLLGTVSSPDNKVPSSAERARQALADARSKSKGSGMSQRLRRPPPGTVLSAADLDASDDDYEPGWASVISSSRS